MGLSDSGDTSSDFNEFVPLNTTTVPINKPRRKKDRKRHACTHEGCNSVFSRPYRLAAHLKVHEGHKPFVCEFKDCTKAYTNKAHLTRHVKTAHNEKKPTPEAYICCPQCEDLFANRQNLKRHIHRKHERDFPFRCESCQIGFLKKTLLAAHMYLHTGVKAFKCDFCEETFQNQTDCYNHKKHHKIYKCFCEKEFVRWSDIVKHRKDEHEFNVFQCDDCGKVFKMRAHIARHMKIHRIPAEQEVFVCPFDQCPKYYLYKSNLAFHIKSVHQETTFDCSVPGCNAKLSTMSILQRHTAKHNLPTRVRKLRKALSKRRDAGVLKRSSAVKLAQVVIPIRMEREIIDQNDIPIDVLCVEETAPDDTSDQAPDLLASGSDMDTLRVKDPTTLYFSTDTINK